MARHRVNPRYLDPDTGEEYLELVDMIIFREINTSWMKNKAQLRKTLLLFQSYSEAGGTWFFVETGIPLLVVDTSDGVRWCVPDNRKNAGRYQWLHSKAVKMLRKVIMRVNEHAPKHIGNVEEGSEDAE